MSTQQIVINVRHGGFGLSKQAQEVLAAKKNIKPGKWHSGIEFYEEMLNLSVIARDDPDLVATVLELGEQASGTYAKLKVVTIPDDVQWSIHEYDGLEWIAEIHRTWS
jgi:hypothetical protein